MKHVLRVLLSLLCLVMVYLTIDPDTKDMMDGPVPSEHPSQVTVNEDKTIFDIETKTHDKLILLKCELTGRPIVNGEEYVKVDGHIYSKVAYDNAPKCSVSGLPISNNDAYITNTRGRDHILTKYLPKANRCISCFDRGLGNHSVNDHFICDHCYETSVLHKSALQKTIEEVEAFYVNQGLTIPGSITYAIDSTLRIDKNGAGEYGLCITRRRFSGGSMNISNHILVMKGLSFTEFAGVLAHEIAHAICSRHFKLNYINDKFSEGRAEYAKYLYFKSVNAPKYMIEAIRSNGATKYSTQFKKVEKKGLPLQTVLTELKI